MKTAIYIEDGVTQIVLTPETKYERDIVTGLGDKLDRVQVFNGGFYDCRGGWIRQSAYYDRDNMGFGADRSENNSLIMRLGRDDSGQTTIQGADRCEVAPGGRGITNEGAQPDAAPGAQPDDRRQDR